MNEEETNKNLSTQKVLSSGHDAGWNDPPKWAYTGIQSSVTPTKRVLNKRVAFPLRSPQATDKESSSNKALNMPPSAQCSTNMSIASHSPLVHASNKDTGVTENEMEIDKEQILNTVLRSLENTINEHISEKSKAEEVRKRLNIMKAAWIDDKLNNVIYKSISDLSIALQEGNGEKADKIHIALMMQHASLCSTWIPGIRHIILELKSKMQNSSGMHCQNSEPHLMSVGEKE